MSDPGAVSHRKCRGFEKPPDIFCLPPAQDYVRNAVLRGHREEKVAMKRRSNVILVLSALSLSLVAGPADAAPLHPKRVTTGTVVGTLERLNTRANTIRLTDGTRFRYDKNDLFNVQHFYDFETEDGDIFCDLFDSGGEGLAARFVARGFTLRVSAQLFSPRSEVSSIFVTANTCDGVVDENDVSLPQP
jgi:hypothetical protein